MHLRFFPYKQSHENRVIFHIFCYEDYQINNIKSKVLAVTISKQLSPLIRTYNLQEKMLKFT